MKVGMKWNKSWTENIEEETESWFRKGPEGEKAVMGEPPLLLFCLSR